MSYEASAHEVQMKILHKLLFMRSDTDEKIVEKQPKLSVILIVENQEGKFLSQQRLK